jgi:hypothetical protein
MIRYPTTARGQAVTVVTPPVVCPAAFFTPFRLNAPKRAGKFGFVAAWQTSVNTSPPVVRWVKLRAMEV